MRRAVFFAAALTLVVSACSPQSRQEWSNGPVPTCDTTSRGRLLLMAQSAPDATLIPCIDDLPPGWEFSKAFSNASESVLAFTNDTFDVDVDVVLATSCDVSLAHSANSPRPGTQFFVGDDAKTIFFVFSGGCISFEYETRHLAESREGGALLDAVLFMPRDRLRELSGWTL